jgi:hypothetical protein
MARIVSKPKFKLVHKKRTSIGRGGKPTNKHKRRTFKPYRGQG